MIEIVEFRVVEEFASRLFADHEGRRLGDSIREIKLSTDDPRFERVGEIGREIDATLGRSFFHGWDVHRTYSADELAIAECFHLTVTAVFEPAGEQCGTIYDETTACAKCGAGATQVSDLLLDLRKVPKGKDIARTIANEVIVSQRLAERMIDADLSGFELRPAQRRARREGGPLDLHRVPTGREILREAEAAGAPHPTWKFWVWLNKAENLASLEQARAELVASKKERTHHKDQPGFAWHQLLVTSSEADICPPTRVGVDPFNADPKGECCCSRGDLIGLNLLSEVSVRAESRGDADFVCSRQFIGTRRGLLRPRRVVLISPKARRLFESMNLKGANVEVAHLA